mmetsp:Transcript_6318/g.16330  ORF Transcript_6318/g.16330 Transcript_6318/m.16330 type:complete len:211 (-) Transcript_6318:269-901(-)
MPRRVRAGSTLVRAHHSVATQEGFAESSGSLIHNEPRCLCCILVLPLSLACQGACGRWRSAWRGMPGRKSCASGCRWTCGWGWWWTQCLEARMTQQQPSTGRSCFRVKCWSSCRAWSKRSTWRWRRPMPARTYTRRWRSCAAAGTRCGRAWRSKRRQPRSGCRLTCWRRRARCTGRSTRTTLCGVSTASSATSKTSQQARPWATCAGLRM